MIEKVCRKRNQKIVGGMAGSFRYDNCSERYSQHARTSPDGTCSGFITNSRCGFNEFKRLTVPYLFVMFS